MHLPKALAFAVLVATPALAQLAKPNSAGVAMGHVHLFVSDVEGHTKFLTALGGKLTGDPARNLFAFPGTFVLLRQADNTPPSEGSVINHFGFHVKSVPDMLKIIKPFGYGVTQNRPEQAMITTSGGVRVEMLEDKTMSTPLEMHHVHMNVPRPVEAQAWYVKNFGAVPGKRAQYENATLPGVELSFLKSDTALAPTKGRSLDHIGFEVKNIEETVAKLAAAGTKMDVAIRPVPNTKLRVAFFTDPWGSYVELTQGLEAQ